MDKAIAGYSPEADAFQFRAALATLRRAVWAHLWIVVATSLFAVSLVVLYVWIWPPTFQAEVMIAADSDKDMNKAAFYQGWNIFRRDGLTDEATLLTSPPVLKEVARRLDLHYSDVYHPFTSYVLHLWSESAIGNAYRSVKRFFFPPAPSAYAPTAREIEQAKLLKDFEEGVSIKQVGEASIGLLVVKGSNQKVAEIANTIVDVYLDQRRERFVHEAEEAYDALNAETQKAAAELEQLDSEVKKFRRDNGMVLLFEKDRAQLTQWATLRGQVTDLEASIADNENALREVDRQLAAEAPQISSDTVFQTTAAKDRLAKLESQLANTKQLFQPNAPEVRELEEQIRIARAALENDKPNVVVRNSELVSGGYEQLRARKLAIESQLSGSRASLETKRREAGRMRALMDQLPEKMQANAEYERRIAVLEVKYRGLNEKLSMAAVSKATARSAPPAMRVVERASAPEQPVEPRTKTLLIAAALLGLVAGCLGALALDFSDLRANRQRLLQHGDYRVYAVVPSDPKFVARLYEPRELEAA